MKKSIQKYFIAVRFPAPWSSNDSEVDWYEIKASSEEAAIKIATRKAARRLNVITLKINGVETKQRFY